MKYQITSKSVYYVYTFLKPKTVLVKSFLIFNKYQLSLSNCFQIENHGLFLTNIFNIISLNLATFFLVFEFTCNLLMISDLLNYTDLNVFYSDCTFQFYYLLFLIRNSIKKYVLPKQLLN